MQTEHSNNKDSFYAEKSEVKDLNWVLPLIKIAKILEKGKKNKKDKK